jgi:hypothetical protein
MRYIGKIFLSILFLMLISGCNSMPSPSIKPSAIASTALPSTTLKATATPIETASITPTPTADAKPAVKINEVKKIPMNSLISELNDVYEYSKGYYSNYSYLGNTRIVKRGDVAYYASGFDIRLFEGNTTYVILRDVDASWMYIDEDNNLWFLAKGGISIQNGWLNELGYLYKYNCNDDSFSIAIKANDNCSLVNEHGFITRYKSYFLYFDDQYLKAFNMKNGSIVKIAKVSDYPLVFSVDERNAIYYQAYSEDGVETYYLLENLGEKNQKKILLDVASFPGGKFDYRQHIIGGDFDNDPDLYEYYSTGYKKSIHIHGYTNHVNSYFYTKPWESNWWSIEYNIVVADNWIAFPYESVNSSTNEDGCVIDIYYPKVESWDTIHISGWFAFNPDRVNDGQFWFMEGDENSTIISSFSNGVYTKYDFTPVIDDCYWAGKNGKYIFLFDDYERNNDVPFTHIFLPETKELYEVDFPAAINEEYGD